MSSITRLVPFTPSGCTEAKLWSICVLTPSAPASYVMRSSTRTSRWCRSSMEMKLTSNGQGSTKP